MYRLLATEKEAKETMAETVRAKVDSDGKNKDIIDNLRDQVNKLLIKEQEARLTIAETVRARVDSDGKNIDIIDDLKNQVKKLFNERESAMEDWSTCMKKLDIKETENKEIGIKQRAIEEMVREIEKLRDQISVKDMENKDLKDQLNGVDKIGKGCVDDEYVTVEAAN